MSNIPTDPFTPGSLFGALPLIKLRFYVTIPGRESLPPFLGSAWRGLIGWELQRTICPFPRKRPCGSCRIREQCPYFQLIEEHTPPGGPSDLPRGYILYPRDADGKDRVYLDLTLAGDMAKYLELLIMVITDGMSVGLGKNKISYRIDRITEIHPGGDEIPVNVERNGPPPVSGPFELDRWIEGDPEKSIDDFAGIRFTTPVRLRKKGAYLNGMDWPFFFGAVVRRLEGLNAAYNYGEPLGKQLWGMVQEMFAAIGPVTSDLKWDDMARYSSRQKQKVPMGGLTGTVRPDAAHAWLAPWWRAAELVHVGKGAAMGWGKIDLI